MVPTGEPRVRVTPFARIYELATLSCCFKQNKLDEKKTETVGQKAFSLREVDPPRSLIMTLMERGEWSHIRPLDAMVSWPVLRPDGTIFDGAGYDARTRCYSTANTQLSLPPCITPKHVEAAIAALHDIVCDFPFEKPEHRSAWLAALLAVLARPAVRGPIPMVIFDANDRGAGKTMLCDTIGTILTGQKLPRRGVPDKGSDDEWGKMMLGIGIGSYPIVLFDNVNGMLRSATLDMVLTGESFQGRVLGMNKEMRVPIRTQFLVSSNNAIISPDLIRRSLHCRIIAGERPELRTGFKHQLPAAAAMVRPALLQAAFTILLGYEQAGRPKVQRRELGSYESWGERIQSAMIWAGLPDPVETQDELRAQADAEADQLGPLLSAWSEMFGHRAVTVAAAVKECVELADDSNYRTSDPKAVALLEALAALGDYGKRPASRQIGNHIRKWKDKWLNQMCFVHDGETGGSARWKVVRL